MACDYWEDIRDELTESIRAILRCDTEAGKGYYQTENMAEHFMVRPFMERNGYADGRTWWFPDSGQ